MFIIKRKRVRQIRNRIIIVAELQLFAYLFTMADYWKSQAKKYCEFCKCWLADNKPSIEFHEKGRKHKENVSRHLRAIGKKSRRDQKEMIKTDEAIRKMESAALEAYRKDIASNADLSSRVINESLEKDNLELSSKKIWYEVKKDGKTYYWNTETNETTFQPPACGFLNHAEQQIHALKVGKKQLQASDKYRNAQDKIKAQEVQKQLEEERAAAAREKMKVRRVEETPEPVTFGPILEQHSGPYGRWKTVQTEPKKIIDLQLPKPEETIAIYVPAEKPRAPPREFKERTVTSLADDEDYKEFSTSFKKRKFAGNQKKNMRQRLNDD